MSNWGHYFARRLWHNPFSCPKLHNNVFAAWHWNSEVDELGQKPFRFRTLGAQILGKFGMICWLKLKKKIWKVLQDRFRVYIIMLGCSPTQVGVESQGVILYFQSVVLDSLLVHCHWMVHFTRTELKIPTNGGRALRVGGKNIVKSRWWDQSVTIHGKHCKTSFFAPLKFHILYKRIEFLDVKWHAGVHGTMVMALWWALLTACVGEDSPPVTGQHGFRSLHLEFQLHQSHQKILKPYLQCFGGGNFFASEGFGFFWIRWKFQPWLLWYYARGKGQWLNDVESRANRKKGWGMQAMSQIFLGASNQNSSSLKDSLHIVGWPSVNPDELFCLLKGPDGDVSFPPFWATQKLGHARTFGLDSPRPLMA